MYANKFRWTEAYILALFTLVEDPYFGWHKHQRCIVAKYDYGHLLYVLFLQPYKRNIHIQTPRSRSPFHEAVYDRTNS